MLSALVERMIRGDQQAMGEFYDHTSGVIFALALRVLQNHADAEEAVLDTYSRAWRQVHAYDPSRGSIMTWLIMMARSIAIDRLRSGASRAEKTQPLDEPRHETVAAGGDGPEAQAVHGERSARIRAAMSALPAEQREVIELAFFSGLSHSELAERTGLPLGTVKTRVRLGLQRLRGELGDLV